MPTLAELTELQQRAFHEVQLARAATDWSKAQQYLDEIEKRSGEIQSARNAEERFKAATAEWETPVGAVPVTTQERRDNELNEEERGARTDANYKPRGWANDLETREALGPAIQPPWIQNRMGDNLKHEARQYLELYERWMRAPHQHVGQGAFFQTASASEQRMMDAYYDKENGGYYVPEILRMEQRSRYRMPEIRAMGENADAAGGLFVPEDFQPILLHDPGFPGGIIRPRCRVITTSLRDGYLPAIGSVTWAAMSEAGTYGDNTPTTGQVSFTVRKSGGQVIISNELLEDTAIALPPIISQIFTESKGRYEDQQIIQGDGTTTFEGLRTSLGSGQTVTLAGSAAIIATDVLNIYWSLPAQFRQAASWYLTSVLMQQIEGIGATAAGIHFGGGDYGAGVNLAMSPENALRGKPVDIFDGTGWDMANPISTGEVIGAFGNFRNYYLIDRVGMSLKRDDSINVKSDQVWFGARMRSDGRVGIQNSFRLIKAA